MTTDQVKGLTPITKAGLALAACGLGLIIYFRQFIFSGGSMIMGDMADGRLILAIHEHWFRFLQGKDGWLDLGFFYPSGGTLGYSDTYLLQGILHSLFRLGGADAYLAFQLVQMAMAGCGFAGMVVWLNRFRGVSLGWALYGGFLLLIASPVFIAVRNSHIQLQAVWIVPWLFILLETVWGDVCQRPRRLLFSFTALCMLYGLLAYSSYYIAWFTLLFLVVWACCGVALAGWRGACGHCGKLFKNWLRLIPGVATAAAFLLLFITTYLPTRLEFGGRSLGSAIRALPYPWDFINHGSTSLLWGRIYALLPDYHPHMFWELEIGPTLVLTVCVLAFAVMILRRPGGVEETGVNAARVTAAALLVSFALQLRIGHFSLWALPYYSIPGADGIRASFRYIVLLMVPAILLLVMALAHLRKRVGGALGASLALLLAGLIVLEQVQTDVTTKINRAEELAHLSKLPEPPADATAFFAVKEYWGDYARDSIHNSAIIYSQQWDLPTVGGRSGFAPREWGMFDPRLPQVYPKLVHWCEVTGITGAVYLFDVDRLAWRRPIRIPESPEGLMGIDLTTLAPSWFSRVAETGWSNPEDWGVWSEAKVARLRIPEFKNPAAGLVANLAMQAFVSEKHPSQRVKILLNGTLVYDRALSIASPEDTIALPVGDELAKGGAVLEFILDDAVSPAALGMHDDTRELGVVLKEFVILPR